MHTLLATLALDADRERHRDDHGHAIHLATITAQARRRGESRTAALRHLAGTALARVSLASAGAARALDACVADDLVAHLRPTEGR